MRAGRTAVILALGAALLGTLSSSAQQEPGDESEPREIGLVERATGRLAQVDVTVTGPRPTIEGLGVDDFELVVAGRFIEKFLVDGICQPPQTEDQLLEPGGIATAEAPQTAPVAPIVVPRTYLFYFDQHHLRQAGRQNALDISRRLIPELIVNGNRAMIVSAGEELVTFAEFTDDQETLLAALDRIERDRRQWDQFPALEEVRIDEVLNELTFDSNLALSMARQHQRQEVFRTERAMRLFSMVIGRFADVNPPKAVIYFADTARRNAGEHYLSYFGRTQRASPENQAFTSAMELEAFGSAAAFDKVIEEAAAHGVRLYTVQAEGLVGPSSMIGGGPQAPAINTRRVNDAQDSLSSLALETGGQAFLNGIPAPKIARRIATDLNCVYLLSFDPAGLPEDAAIPVVVRVKRPKVQAHARGMIMVQSESSRVTSQLMAAFVSPDAVNSDWPLRGVIVPTGYKDGRFHSLVQVSVPGFPLANAEWDLGLSLVSRGRVREDVSSRIKVETPSTPVVLEAEVSFKPGPYEIIMVAREINSGQLATTSIQGDWPDPDQQPASVGPIAILQPSPGAFLRDGELRTRGALGRDDRQPARTDLPTVLITLVCRGRGGKSEVGVERQLVGESPTDFPRIELELGEDRCAQIRDAIPAGMMTPGGFTYEVTVKGRDEELASASAEFGAVAPNGG